MDDKWYGVIVDSCERLGAFPFHWNWDDHTLLVTNSRKQWIKWGAAVGSLLIFCIFLLLRGFFLLRNPNGRNTETVLRDVNTCFSFGINMMVPLLLQLMTASSPESIVQSLNVTLRFSKRFCKKFENPSQKASKRGSQYLKSKSVDEFLKSMKALVFIFPILTTVLCITQPQMPIWMISTLPDDVDPAIFWTRMLAEGCWGYWTISCSWHASLYYISAGLQFPIVFRKIHQQLDLSLSPEQYWTTDQLREPRYLRETFRCLQLVNDQMESNARSIYMPLQVFISRMVNVGVYILIRYSKEMPISFNSIIFFMSFSMNMVQISLLKMFGKQHKISQSCRMSWKISRKFWTHGNGLDADKKMELKEFKKFVKSTHPIATRFGDFGEIKNMHVLRYVIANARGIMRLLVAV